MLNLTKELLQYFKSNSELFFGLNTSYPITGINKPSLK